MIVILWLDVPAWTRKASVELTQRLGIDQGPTRLDDMFLAPTGRERKAQRLRTLGQVTAWWPVSRQFHDMFPQLANPSLSCTSTVPSKCWFFQQNSPWDCAAEIRCGVLGSQVSEEPRKNSCAMDLMDCHHWILGVDPSWHQLHRKAACVHFWADCPGASVVKSTCSSTLSTPLCHRKSAYLKSKSSTYLYLNGTFHVCSVVPHVWAIPESPDLQLCV